MIQITLSDVEVMVADLIRRQQELAAYMAVASVMNERVQKLETELIPNVLKEVGLTELKLQSGQKLTVEPVISTSISEANWPGAEAWLQEHNSDGIIKNMVALLFDKGENDNSEWFKWLLKALVSNDKLREELSVFMEDHRQMIEENIDDPLIAEVQDKKNIHPQTLKAFVREQMRNGVSLPEDLFGLHLTEKIKIK